MEHFGFLALLIGTLLACGAVPPEKVSREIGAHQLYVRGVVVDAELGRVFALGRERRLQVLDLDSGEALWRGTDPAAPELVARLGRWLVGLEAGRERHRLRFAIFNLDKLQAPVARSEEVELPEWISVVEQRGRSFGLWPEVRAGQLEIDWTARSWYAGGARPTEKIRAAARRQAHGRVVVDPRDGTVATAPRPVVEPEDEARSEPYWDGYGFTDAPLAIEDSAAVLALSPVTGGEMLDIRRLDGRGDAVVLATGRGLKAQLTADRGHLLVSSLDPQGVESLTLFSLSPLERRLTLPAAPWPLHAGVLGSWLFRVSELRNPAARRLEVVRLTDGRELWSAPLAAPALGPMPR